MELPSWLSESANAIIASIVGGLIVALIVSNSITLNRFFNARRYRRYTRQGEDIGNRHFSSGEDPDDETGIRIVNDTADWTLEGAIDGLGKKGAYLANIRFKKLQDTTEGDF